MCIFLSLIPVITLLFLTQFGQATYSASSRSNVALYWGQGPGQQRLLHFCSQSTVDIIPIGFVDVFPAQGNGFPGTNFGNQCWGPPYVYTGPGPNPTLNKLQSQCPQLTADVPLCQSTYGKKIILSLGGGLNTYQLTGAAEGVAFADFLWGAFGPQTPAWLSSGKPRPFDGPGNASVEVDGFDFDIEFPSIDNSAGYVAMITRLRSLFTTASKPYLITGAPQCVVPDANMGQMITQAKFDIIFIQYYNTPFCSARAWVTANPNYLATGVEASSGFTYDAWSAALAGTASANAKLYIGLPGAVSGNFYLTPTELSSIVKAYFCKPNFGGIMLWDATSAENNPSGPYYAAVKNLLAGYATNPALSCYTAPVTSLTRYPSTTLSTSSLRSSSTTIKVSSTIKLSSASSSVSTLKSSTKSSTLTTIPRSSRTSSTATNLFSSTKVITLKSSSSLKSSTSKKVSTIINNFTSFKSSSFVMKPSSSLKSSSSLKVVSTSPIKPTSSTLKATTTSALKSSTTSTTTKTSSTSALPIVIPDGACGAPYGNSCATGYCCSQYGYCGSGTAWCGTGCQPAFGICT